MGVALSATEDQSTRWLATDGHRLAKIVVKNPEAGKDTQQELIIPTKFLNLI